MQIQTRMHRAGARLLSAGLASAVLLPATLDAQLSGGREGTLDRGVARIAYVVVGEGDPIVVVHGGPGLDHRYLRPGLDVLASRRSVVYYDQRGLGGSSAPIEASAINVDAFVGDIEALREALGRERIVLLGHSYGTLLALEFAFRHPDRLRALILMNPVEPGSRFRDEARTRQMAARTERDVRDLAALTASEAFAARDPEALGDVYRVLYRASFRDPRRVDELDLRLAPATARNGEAVATLFGESLGQVDWWDRLGELGTPTLVIHGRYDAPPVAMAESLLEALPRGRLAVLETGHFPYVEDPRGLANAVADFLSDVR